MNLERTLTRTRSFYSLTTKTVEEKFTKYIIFQSATETLNILLLCLTFLFICLSVYIYFLNLVSVPEHHFERERMEFNSQEPGRCSY